MYNEEGIHMAVSYNGLWKLLIDKKMKKVDMMNQVGISSSTVAKMTNAVSYTHLTLPTILRV